MLGLGPLVNSVARGYTLQVINTNSDKLGSHDVGSAKNLRGSDAVQKIQIL